MSELLVGALGLDISRIGSREEHRAGKILRMMGFAKNNVRVDGRLRKLWCCPMLPHQ
jgi:hypothetical protein